jgi:hypothetical protein
MGGADPFNYSMGRPNHINIPKDGQPQKTPTGERFFAASARRALPRRANLVSGAAGEGGSPFPPDRKDFGRLFVKKCGDGPKELI